MLRMAMRLMTMLPLLMRDDLPAEFASCALRRSAQGASMQESCDFWPLGCRVLICRVLLFVRDVCFLFVCTLRMKK